MSRKICDEVEHFVIILGIYSAKSRFAFLQEEDSNSAILIFPIRGICRRIVFKSLIFIQCSHSLRRNILKFIEFYDHQVTFARLLINSF